MRPLFLFSLPRSGSTLVQRVLAAHPGVATASEPWLLLPHLYATRAAGARAEYWHEAAAEAVGDFIQELPGGARDYREALREFALSLYERAAGGDKAFFLDKTPHYHAVAREIMNVFPDGRFVFLWRNPLAVLASCLGTFREGRWEPYHFSFDVFDGVANLVTAYDPDDERIHAVRYEDLVREGNAPWRRLFAHLGLEFDPALLQGFHDVELRGRYGDPTGIQRYGEIAAGPLDKWRPLVAGRLRLAWCRRYLRWIGAERMGVMGYDLEALLAELDAMPVSGTGAVDLIHAGTSFMRDRLLRRALRLPDSPRPRGGRFQAGER